MATGRKYKYSTLRIRSRHPSHSILRRNKNLMFDEPVVYRLGSTSESPITKEINSIESIRVSSNKFKMKEAFKANNVQSTEFYYKNEVPKDVFPIIAKKQFGSKGKGMVKIDDLETLNSFLDGDTRGYYFEKYFNGSREYRLHVSELGCFYACRKLRKNDAEDRWYFNSNNCVWYTEKEQILDDAGNFVSFSDVDNPRFSKPSNWEEVVKQCQEAIKAVGLDVGAVDVRMSSKGDFRILETNSAPSFGNITSQMYIDHLPKLIQKKFTLKKIN